VGISVGKQASCYELLRRAGAFAVSLLGSEQEALALRFAAGHPPIVHWQGVDTREGAVAPLVEGGVGWIEARTVAEHDVGDHTFFVGAVLTVERGPSTRALMYRDREYHGL
jgi:flavin reductase (DIM6/NTAB) family NADH-FMN oxidoreductase RutF